MAHRGASTISVASNGRKLRQLAEQSDWASGASSEQSDGDRDKSKSGARFKQVAKKWRSLGDLDSCSTQTLYKPKSVILPYSSQPQAHQFFKTDPVALYHYYRKEWANRKMPGEKEHKQLRWNIRTRMARRDEPPATNGTNNKRTLSRLSVFTT